MSGKQPAPGTTGAPPGPGAAGPSACRIARFGLVVADIELAERFFAAAFGFTTADRAAGDNGFADLAGMPGALIRQARMRLGDLEFPPQPSPERGARHPVLVSSSASITVRSPSQTPAAASASSSRRSASCQR